MLLKFLFSFLWVVYMYPTVPEGLFFVLYSPLTKLLNLKTQSNTNFFNFVSSIFYRRRQLSETVKTSLYKSFFRFSKNKHPRWTLVYPKIELQIQQQHFGKIARRRETHTQKTGLERFICLLLSGNVGSRWCVRFSQTNA